MEYIMSNTEVKETTSSGNIDKAPKIILKAIPKEKNWILLATKHKGALKKKAAVAKAITKTGNIKKAFLIKSAKKGNTKLAKQARLVLTLSKFKKK